MQRTLVTLVALYHARLLGQLHATAAVQHLGAADKGSQKTPNKTVEFLNIIKEDLRRNNDDYAVFEHKLFLETPTSGSPPEVERQPAPLQQPNRIPPSGGPEAGSGPQVVARPGPPLARPALAAAGARPPPLVRQPGRALPRKPLGAPPHRLQRPRLPLHVPINTRRGVNMTIRNDTYHYGHMTPNATQFRSYTHSKHYKKVRVDKLKRLVDKGKNRMRDHAGRTGPENLNEAQGSPGEKAVEGGDEVGTMATTPEMQHEDIDASVPADVITDATQTTTLSLSEMLATTKKSHEAPKLRHHVEQHAQSPSPDQLDMAPARGPAITLIRFKGRLCQRSILNMEGPSYGKDGSMVMDAYNPEHEKGREFDDTTPANPILPRCCNCCKKSVLGCQ
ncbi:uncharacterized protein LOC111358088 [Spodoptera litura]|uniref:Uncharacterized protein LOC111358088 n=1 Tax=Spodoptera litura TaxID=69820 RepID=A0A9J7IX17_SPOLT|nr:uncharacterized protein LOC111358088 [Spodoptera litura]